MSVASVVRRLRAGSAPVLLLSWLAVACGSELEVKRPSGVSAVPNTSIGTVVRVTWRTEEPTIGYVEYGPDAAMQWSTPLEEEPTREHSATLLGLTGDTNYSFRVVTWDGDDAGASEVSSFRTGALPAGLPAFTTTGTSRMYVVAPLRGTSPGVAILDPSGNVVWYHADTSGLDVLRARVSADRRSVLYNRTQVDADSAENSAIVRVALDGSGVTELPVPFLAHDFLELDGGRFAAITVDRRNDAAGNSVRGDAIVEIEPTGTVRTIWSVWDSFDPASVAGDGTGGAWTYANSLARNNDGSYYVSFQNWSSVLKIPPGGTAPEWVLGGSEATLQFGPGETPFARQSGIVAFYGDGLLVLDNQGAGTSRVVEYKLSPSLGNAVDFGRFSPMPGVSVGELGGVVRLDDGSLIASWGEAGRMDLVGDEGSVWSLTRASGTANFGYHDVVNSLYAGRSRTPRTEP